VIVGAFATIALAVAVGSSIITGNAASGDNAHLQSEIGALKTRLAVTERALGTTAGNLAAATRALSATRGRLNSYGAELTALRMSTDARNLWGSVSELKNSVRQLTLCMPELQRELAGLRRAATVSSDCTGVLLRR
jgi:hypothetical protein